MAHSQAQLIWVWPLVDWEGIVSADENVEKLIFAAHDAPNNPGVGCIITDVGDVEVEEESKNQVA